MSLSDSYERKTGTEVNPRQLQTPCSQVDLVSLKQPQHYNRKLTGKGVDANFATWTMPWAPNDENEPNPGQSLYKVPSELHEKPFNSQGAPGFNAHVHKPGYRQTKTFGGVGLPGPMGGSGPPIECVRERPYAQDREDDVFRGERRCYTVDTKWSRAAKNKKFSEDDSIFQKKPKSELHCSRTALAERWPSENKNEALWAPNIVPKNVDTSRKALRERPLFDPEDFRTSKYGLYVGRFDRPGTKPRYLPGDLFSGTVEPERPRWGYCSKATTRANEDAKRQAAAQRSFDILRPRQSLSCPEMGYHYTHR